MRNFNTGATATANVYDHAIVLQRARAYARTRESPEQEIGYVNTLLSTKITPRTHIEAGVFFAERGFSDVMYTPPSYPSPKTKFPNSFTLNHLV